MIASNLVNSAIPPLKPTDTIQTAINWMDKLRLSELPVVKEGKFVGLLTEKEILDGRFKPMDLIGDITINNNVYVNANDHYFEAIKIASQHKVKSVGVLSLEGEYLGILPLKDTVTMFSQMAAMQGPGAIIVLKMQDKNYSLAEISRLIEENDVKILSVHVGDTPSDVTGEIRVTIKLSTPDSSRVIATLERFGYVILASFSSEELQSSDSDRLDMLLHYLNI